MSEEIPEFGMKRERNLFEEDIGKYVVITSGFNQGTWVGFLKKVYDNYGILNPHQEINYPKENGKIIAKYEIKETDMKVPLDKCVIRETTLEYMVNYCEMQNQIIRNTYQNKNPKT